MQAHWSWAYGLDVVLLASGYSKPADYGATGSGIYIGQKGAIMYYTTGTQGSRLLVADVPKKISSLKGNIRHQYRTFCMSYRMSYTGDFNYVNSTIACITSL